jgi:O-antigen/teichoic acid export membrane protein
VITLFWTVILAHSLGLANFGEYAYLVALAILLSIFSEAGLSTVIARDVARQPKDQESVLATAMTATLGLNVVAALVLVAIDLLHSNSGQHIAYAALISLYLPVNGLNNILAAVLRARDRFSQDSLVNLADAGLFAILSGAAIVGHLGLAGVVGAYAARQYLVFGLYALLVRRLVGPWRFGFSASAARYLGRDGIPLTISGAAAHAYVRVDAVLLSFLATTTAVGIYSIATRFIDAMMVLVTAVGAATLPSMAVLAARRRELHSTTVRTALVAAVAFAVVILPVEVLSPWLIGHLFGREFIASEGVLRVLVLVIPLYAGAQVLRSFLVAVGAQAMLTSIYVLALVTNVALNFLLIPRLSYYGSSLAAVVTAVLVAAASGLGASWLDRRSDSWGPHLVEVREALID